MDAATRDDEGRDPLPLPEAAKEKHAAHCAAERRVSTHRAAVRARARGARGGAASRRRKHRRPVFPLDCLISVTVTMLDGRTAETGVVGSREVVGINAMPMGGRETTQTEYVVQIAGDTIRVPAQPLRELFDHERGVRSVLLKYTQAMFAQVTQNAACNSLHTLDQRFARWLLESRDRIGSDELQLTHEFISEMLGVRRAGVSDVSRRFEKLGAIRHRRGRIQIADEHSSKRRDYECYPCRRRV